MYRADVLGVDLHLLRAAVVSKPKLCLNPEHETEHPTEHSGDFCPTCGGERLKFEPTDPGLDDLMPGPPKCCCVTGMDTSKCPVHSSRICTKCHTGDHLHDTWGPNAPEVASGEHREGEDAGCPYRAADGRNQCACRHVNPRKKSKHCPTCRCT
jgi:hypothetical protein